MIVCFIVPRYSPSGFNFRRTFSRSVITWKERLFYSPPPPHTSRYWNICTDLVSGVHKGPFWFKITTQSCNNTMGTRFWRRRAVRDRSNMSRQTERTTPQEKLSYTQTLNIRFVLVRSDAKLEPNRTRLNQRRSMENIY